MGSAGIYLGASIHVAVIDSFFGFVLDSSSAGAVSICGHLVTVSFFVCFAHDVSFVSPLFSFLS